MICNTKFAILIVLSVQFSGINYIHSVCNHHYYFYNFFTFPNKNFVYIKKYLRILPSAQPLVTSGLIAVLQNC